MMYGFLFEKNWLDAFVTCKNESTSTKISVIFPSIPDRVILFLAFVVSSLYVEKPLLIYFAALHPNYNYNDYWLICSRKSQVAPDCAFFWLAAGFSTNQVKEVLGTAKRALLLQSHVINRRTVGYNGFSGTNRAFVYCLRFPLFWVFSEYFVCWIDWTIGKCIIGLMIS